MTTHQKSQSLWSEDPFPCEGKQVSTNCLQIANLRICKGYGLAWLTKAVMRSQSWFEKLDY